MPRLMYMDAARMGRMSAGTQKALQDFVRLVGEEGGTLYFESFLRCGFARWPHWQQRKYSSLSNWNGVTGLCHDLARLVGLTKAGEVHLASRSAHWMKLAARLLFKRCRRVLTTDLSWPGYARILERIRRKAHGQTSLVRVRDLILQDRVSPAEILDCLAKCYLDHECDGIFLPEISHDGLRLPLADLRRRIDAMRPPRFIVVDGSQALGHMPIDLSVRYCDFFIAGSHKWLGGYLPLGIAFCPSAHSRDSVISTACELARNGSLGDPLTSFVGQLDSRRAPRVTETVNLAPLFSCRAALADLLREESDLASAFDVRLSNAAILSESLTSAGWTALVPAPPFRTGILLVRASNPAVRSLSGEDVRARFHSFGISLTCYGNGLVRLSLPSTPWSAPELQLLLSAFRRCSEHRTVLQQARSCTAPSY